MAKNTLRKILLLILSFPFLAIALQGQQQKSVPKVRAYQIEQLPFYDTIEALGSLKANESVNIASLVTDKIEKIHFNDGEKVKKGQVLIEMIRDEEQAKLDEAKSLYEEAKSQYERTQGLIGKGAISESSYDERKSVYETAKAKMEQWQYQLNDRVLRAPFDGMVGLRDISVGSFVSSGDTLTTLDDLSVMKLDFNLSSTFLSEIKKDLRITAVSKSFPGTEFTGTIYSIGTRIDPQTRSFNVRALIPNPDDKLKPGLLMKVFIQSNERETLLLPESAILNEGQKHYVYKITEQEGKKIAQKTFVEIGGRKLGVVEITDGLKNGDIVITHDGFKIKNLQEVSPELESLEGNQ